MQTNGVSTKPRIIVLTDISSLIGGWREPDDTQSLVRFLLYSNEFDVEGLIATASGWPQPKTEFIEAIVQAYGRVRANLLLHSPDYPSVEHLLACTKGGLPKRGVGQIGDAGDSEASEWIISVVDKPDPRPVWIIIWGAPTDLAQALWRVRQDRSAEELKAFMSKIRVNAIADQDDTGPWIKENYPDLFYVTWIVTMRGIYRGGDTSLVSADWVYRHVHGHGCLGNAYPIYDGGDCFTGEVRGLKEGDTPSYLCLIPNGLSDPEHPDWGSWGGRFVAGENPNQFTDAADYLEGEESVKATVYRWRAAFQADFQARLDWCVRAHKRANHPPVAVVAGETERTVAPGEEVMFDASGSHDPDGDRLTFSWSFYQDPSTYKERRNFRPKLGIRNAASPRASLVAPEVASPVTLHVILTVTDDGTPPLSRYRRVLIHVDPARGNG
ncbi:MAG: DUF1593 domain-containing protein [Kiritimatiellae bacterium]|nr:DUF1593 domain-containing protein [Kiritimatiellia bacterium]